ncbi:MAG: signal peptidase II [Spirochaetaceae bacterium]
MATRKELLRPLLLIALIVTADQITKMLVVQHIAPLGDGGPIIQVIGDFVRLIHARNLGIAFSMGHGLEAGVRSLLFAALPAVVLLALMVYYFRTDELTSLQRWAIAGIVGGGLGNLIDRVFRSAGVVDFIDVKFYGLFGMERWPTFNIADAGVVVCGILLVATIFIGEGSAEHEQEG